MRRPPSRHASARPPPRCSPAFCLKQSIILSESRLSNSTYPLYARSQPPLLPEAPNAPRHCGGRHFFFGQVWCRRITYVKCVCAVKRQLRVKRSKLWSGSREQLCGVLAVACLRHGFPGESVNCWKRKFHEQGQEGHVPSNPLPNLKLRIVRHPKLPRSQVPREKPTDQPALPIPQVQISPQAPPLKNKKERKEKKTHPEEHYKHLSSPIVWPNTDRCASRRPVLVQLQRRRRSTTVDERNDIG